MLQELNRLSQEDRDLLMIVPVWVCMLVAGADNRIDKRELRKAIEVANEKQKEGSILIRKFYSEIAEQFETNLKGYIALLPEDADARNKILISKIEQLNKILPVLDRKFALAYYSSLNDFALEVAEASGGVFGIGAINKDEAQFVDLPMIVNPATFENEVN